MSKEYVTPPVRHFSPPIALGRGATLRRGRGFRILASALGLSILFFSLAKGDFCEITEADDGEPIIRYVVRPDPDRAVEPGVLSRARLEVHRDPEMVKAGDEGRPMILQHTGSLTAKAVDVVMENLVKQVESP